MKASTRDSQARRVALTCPENNNIGLQTLRYR